MGDIDVAIESLMQMASQPDVAPGVYMVIKPESGFPFGSSNQVGANMTALDTLKAARSVLQYQIDHFADPKP